MNRLKRIRESLDRLLELARKAATSESEPTWERVQLTPEDAEFLAVCSPLTITRLIERVKKAEGAALIAVAHERNLEARLRAAKERAEQAEAVANELAEQVSLAEAANGPYITTLIKQLRAAEEVVEAAREVSTAIIAQAHRKDGHRVLYSFAERQAGRLRKALRRYDKAVKE